MFNSAQRLTRFTFFSLWIVFFLAQTGVLQIDFQHLLDQAQIALQQENWEQSLSLYRRVVESDSESVSAWIGVGVSLSHLERNSEAIVSLERAVELAPEDARIQGVLARTYFKNRQYDQADEWYQKAIKLHPTSAPVSWYLDLGLIEMHRGHFEQARRYYLVAVQLHPKSVVAYQNLGLLLLNQNRFDEADACFYTALTVEPEIGSALFGRGEVAFKRGNYSQAVDFYQQAIQQEPTVSEYYYALAQALLRSGKMAEGKASLAQAKRLKAKLLRQEAHQAARKKDWPQVALVLRQAIERDPTYVDAVEDLAYLQVQQGELAEAESTLNTVLRLVTDWAPGYWQRGDVRYQQKKYEQAEEDLRRAIELAPSAAPPRFSLAQLLFDQQEASLPEAENLAESAYQLDPQPKYNELLQQIRRTGDHR